MSRPFTITANQSEIQAECGGQPQSSENAQPVNPGVAAMFSTVFEKVGVKVSDKLHAPSRPVARGLLGFLGLMAIPAGYATAAPTFPTRAAAYEQPGSIPDAFDVINKAQQLITATTPLQEGEKIDLSSPKDVVTDLQSSYLWEKVTRVSVKQRRGSKKIRLSLRQEDLMAQAALGTVYKMETIPGAPGVPDVQYKEVKKIFHYLFSPDIFNEFRVKVRAGTMTREGKCAYLGKAVIMPSFERYEVVPLSAEKEIKPGDSVTVGQQVFRAPNVTDALVAPHTSTHNLNALKPFSLKSSRGSCVSITQSWEARRPSYYKFSRDTRGQVSTVYGPFNKATQSKAHPKYGSLKP